VNVLKNSNLKILKILIAKSIPNKTTGKSLLNNKRDEFNVETRLSISKAYPRSSAGSSSISLLND
jgi:hypothetical protein